jgi:RimJ/RimL family protein N-acetyltransferase
MNKFAVRPLGQEDIPHIIDYWVNASPEHLLAMGADIRKVPARTQWQANLENILTTPEPEAKTFYLIWLVDGRAIGFNSLKNIVYGERGEMHLHVWEKESRGKGYGGPLFCLATVEFFERFKLKTIYCEPRVSNPAPNRLLQRIGFPLILTHTAATSEVSLVCEVNRYQIVREIAEQHLRKTTGT